MLYNPYGDAFGGATTNELVCALVHRFDAPNCLHSLLALMAEASTELPIDKQWRMACSMEDMARLIKARPAVKLFVELLDEFVPVHDEGAPR